MKKLIYLNLGFVLFVFLLSCNNNNKSTPGAKDKNDQPAVAKSATGFTGTYTTTENDMPMQFILKDDGTGQENYHGTMRPLTWTKKGEKVFFTYDGQTTEFELPIDMEKGEIHYGSLVYKKE